MSERRGAVWREQMRGDHELRRMRREAAGEEAERYSSHVPHFTGPGGVTLKSCSMCGSPKPLEDFPADASTWDALRCSCKPCTNGRRRQLKAAGR